MNERIRELVDQCHHQYSEHNIDLEKFAELIIKECIAQCNDGDSRYFIATHFGVEE